MDFASVLPVFLSLESGRCSSSADWVCLAILFFILQLNLPQFSLGGKINAPEQNDTHGIRGCVLRVHVCTDSLSLGAPLSYLRTLTAIPGVIEYQGARIQLLDLPGIVEGASQGYSLSPFSIFETHHNLGRGRGRQVVSTAKTADLILIMVRSYGLTDDSRTWN